MGSGSMAGFNTCSYSLWDGQALICVPGTGRGVIPEGLAHTCLPGTSSDWWE